ncbi:aspartate/glutamate racemase family protein [Roseobacter sp. YSTF-M11]|uniref:Aspartate/glutamate racemase family protein n=1 Tax=Roseobacter insulae TaxID=2859783 RepID=A0A9X1K360_9RHOB|nr:aspartate/glutamate racemase family protein [Roseobacter insulae]MBW4709243.1 aspartate/glutamate racemase family protein [Roseobacter insulae]
MQTGGKTVFGATVGILMLETKFPRIPGDIGNATTWPFPVHYRIVEGATPDLIVRHDAREMRQAFIAEAQALVRMGCDGIVTNCGFLSILQDDLKAALGVPVASSSLMQVPMIAQTLPPGQRVGVLTISKDSLTPDHLKGAGVPLDTPIMGTDGGRCFSQAILSDRAEIDFDACRLDLLDAARVLTSAHDTIGAIVLECTNMVPYARDIRVATGLPVYSIYTLVTWFQAALSPRRFPAELDDPR